MRRVLKRIVLVLALWLVLSATTVIRCNSGSVDDDDEKLKPDRNRAPVASPSFLQTPLSQPISDRMQATDPDGDTLSFRVTAGPDEGSLTGLDERGFFTYVPTSLGSDQFSFRANDGELDSNTAQVVVRVFALAATATRTKPAPIAGVAAVLPDPAVPGGLLVHWGGPAPALERVPGAGLGPIGTLLEGVEAVAADPWQAGRLVALRRDGELLESRDAGGRWRRLATLPRPAAGTALAVGGDRLLLASPGPDCVGPVPPAARGLRIDRVCGRDPFLGPDGAAYYLGGPPAFDRLLAADRDGVALLAGVVHAGAHGDEAARLWAVTEGEAPPRLLRSDDAGSTWSGARDLPPGRVLDALARPGASAWLWLVLAAPDGAIRVLYCDDARCREAGGAGLTAGRLYDCGDRACLLGTAGRLWRLR